MAKKDNFLILYNIRSAYNVGAIFRTADACGIAKIYLTGYTPTPIDRFGRERKDIHKASLGAEKYVAWEYIKNPSKLIDNLKGEGIEIIALEQDKKSVDYRKVKISRSSALILGNEVKGISKSLLSKCDIIAEIPMRGKKESLNVSVSAGIAMFRIFL